MSDSSLLTFGAHPSEYVKKFATKEAAEQAGTQETEEDSDEDMSDVASLSDEDEVRYFPYFICQPKSLTGLPLLLVHSNLLAR